MKQGGFRAVRLTFLLILMLCLTGLPVFASETPVALTSIIMDTFHGETTHSWSFGGRTFTYEYDWALDASRFATRVGGVQFPRITRVPAWPLQVFGVNRQGHDINSLGIWGRFDRRGYNWIDVFPIVPGSGDDGQHPIPFEIPIPGIVRYLDMWVWGSNRNFILEAYVRDHQGIVHVLPMGDMAFVGWRNMRARFPNHIRQVRNTLPRYAGLHFVKFRIWTTPMDRVDDFHVYFNQMKVLTDVFQTFFDGDDLADPARVQEFWAGR